MKQPRRNFSRYLHLLLAALPVCSGTLNTDCNLDDDAILRELPDDHPAKVPKVCFDIGLGTGRIERCFYLLLPECAKESDNVHLVVDLHDS